MNAKAKRSSGGSRTRARLKRRTIAAALVLPLVLAGTWQLFTQPNQRAAGEATAAAAELSQSLSAYEETLNALRNGTAPSARSLLAEAQRLDAQLPPTVSSINLVTLFGQLAGARNLDVTAAVPTEVVAANSKSFTVTVNGTRKAVTGLLADLQKVEPVMTVTDLALTVAAPAGQVTATLQPGQKPSGDTSATFTLTAWYMPDATMAAAS